MYQVMLADDEKWIVEGLKQIIDWNELGLEIKHTAANGKEALEKFERSPVDIVVTDINMPGVNGLALLQTIKQMAPGTKFVILSGYDEFAYAKEAITIGVKRYLLKPVDEEELEETLREVIGEIDRQRVLTEESLLVGNKSSSVGSSKLQRLMMAQDEEGALTHLRAVLEQAVKSEKEGEGLLYGECIRVIMLLDEVCRALGIAKEALGGDLRQMIDAIYHAEELEGLIQFMSRQISQVIKQMSEKETKYTPVVEQIVHYVEEAYKEEMNLKLLAQKYHMNASYLGQIFQKEVGCSFSEYLNQIKNQKAKELILTTNLKMTEVAKQVGYLDTSYFYKKFKSQYGVSPATLREMKVY